MDKAKVSLRSGQIIVPFGIGQIIPNEEGLSLMLGGLNLWEESLKQRETEGGLIQKEDLEIKDERLSKLLNTKTFYKPFPWIRQGWSGEKPNTELMLPGVIFPLWHYCSTCGVMYKAGRTDVNHYCKESSCSGKRRHLIPVRFVAACDKGHIQDVPFEEWVHKGDLCQNPKLRFKAGSGSGNLSSVWIDCLTCGCKRSLGGLLSASRDEGSNHINESALAKELNYTCQGLKPWIGKEGFEPTNCNNHLQVVISGGSNVHYSNIRSALKLPANNEKAKLEKSIKPLTLEKVQMLFEQYKDPELVRGSLIVCDQVASGEMSVDELLNQIESYLKKDGDNEDYDEVLVRKEEFKAFQENLRHKVLVNKVQDIDSDMFHGIFKGITLVEKLTETRVFTGFTRLNSVNALNLSERKRFLTKNTDKDPEWLPAYQTFGEGIFLEFDKKVLESISSLKESKLLNSKISRYHQASRKRNKLYEERDVDPRFVFIHTLAHLLIRRLCFRCGYGSSSLRERIYYSTDENTAMAGILIYTASGDSEGSLGGLVAQGKPEKFREIFEEALRESEWCSADPVCSDIGETSGQGPNNVNGAACHSCTILPETSCEEFNSLLDRNIVNGVLTYLRSEMELQKG